MSRIKTLSRRVGTNHDRCPSSTFDLQIVGAGLSGLLAANLAIDAGLSVRLIERSQRRAVVPPRQTTMATNCAVLILTDGRPQTMFAITTGEAGMVERVYAVVNPDKLGAIANG